jgi:hypothetical protein
LQPLEACLDQAGRNLGGGRGLSAVVLPRWDPSGEISGAASRHFGDACHRCESACGHFGTAYGHFDLAYGHFDLAYGHSGPAYERFERSFRRFRVAHGH